MNETHPQLIAALSTIADDERAQRTSFPELRAVIAAAEPIVVGSTFRRARLASKGVTVTVTAMSTEPAYVTIFGAMHDGPALVADLLDPNEWERTS